MVAWACNPSIGEAETGKSLELAPALDEHPCGQRMTLSWFSPLPSCGLQGWSKGHRVTSHDPRIHPF